MAEFPASLTYHFNPQKYHRKHRPEMAEKDMSVGCVDDNRNFGGFGGQAPQMPALEVLV